MKHGTPVCRPVNGMMIIGSSGASKIANVLRAPFIVHRTMKPPDSQAARSHNYLPGGTLYSMNYATTIPDPAGATHWIECNVEGATPPFTFELIAGGRSNLTYQVIDANRNKYALRRPPAGHILPTAHNMAREYRVISALWPTMVPVARPLALCEDTDVIGAPFYMMSYLDGLVVRDGTGCKRALSHEARSQASRSMVATLASLHRQDVDLLGLGDLGPKEAYIERQLKRWIGQYESSIQSIGKGYDQTDPVVAAHKMLCRSIPASQQVSLVHGDYRLDNLVVDQNGSVVGILDWEICALGDPLADVGLLLVYWAEEEDESPLVEYPATALDGFLSRRELTDLYMAESGLDLADIGYYMSFGYWKLACILSGVYARYISGATGGDTTSVDRYATTITWLAHQALERL